MEDKTKKNIMANQYNQQQKTLLEKVHFAFDGPKSSKIVK